MAVNNHRRCLYIQGEAVEVENINDIELAASLLYGDSGEENRPEAFLGDSQRRIYKATPTDLWLNDKSESEVTRETIKMRIEVSLDAVREMI